MKNLKKLKAVLATELENRQVYKEAFDLVKDAEALEKYISTMSGKAKEIEKEISKFNKRSEAAEAEMVRAEKEYAVNTQAMADTIEKLEIEASRNAEKMVSEANEEVQALLKKKKALIKDIKDEERKTELAVSARIKAEEELEKIRGRLKSI